MRTLYLSHTELEIVSRFWDTYVQFNNERIPEQEKPALEIQGDEILAELTDETREAFLGALDQFELEGAEFQVKIARDDARLVSQQ